MEHIEVKVDKLPGCDFCIAIGEKKEAKYDGRTTFGPWAYMCEDCFRSCGVGLGLGKGQRLVVNED